MLDEHRIANALRAIVNPYPYPVEPSAWDYGCPYCEDDGEGQENRCYVSIVVNECQAIFDKFRQIID